MISHILSNRERKERRDTMLGFENQHIDFKQQWHTFSFSKWMITRNLDFLRIINEEDKEKVREMKAWATVSVGPAG